MTNKSKKSTRQWIFRVLFLVFFILIFLLNRMYPVHSDDWMYSFVFNEEPTRFIHNIGDIFVSQYNHYLYWGGRNVVHFIDQFLLLIPELPREIINSLGFMAFILVIYKMANQNNSLSPRLFLFVGSLLWLGLPTFPQTVIWITGSSNYLWGTLIVLFFLYNYYSFYITEKAKDSKIRALCVFIFGIVAGWTNENLSIALIFILFSLLLYCIIRKIKIPLWFAAGVLGVGIGCGIMLAAPGNFIRSHDTHVALNLDNKALSEVLWFKARNIYLIYKYIPTVFGLILAYLVSVLLYWYGNKQTRNLKILSASILFFIAAHISALAMIVSPIFPVRASFCMHAFMIVAIALLYGDFHFSTKLQKVLNISILSLLCISVGFTYYSIYKPLSYLCDRYKFREQYIESEKSKGIKDIILYEPAIILPGKFDFEDITADQYAWRNSVCADYYQVHSIKRIDKE